MTSLSFEQIQRRLGRAKQWDDRNFKFLLPRKRVPAGVRYRMWNAGPELDQGDTPQCVGYSGWGFLAGGPIINKPPFSPTDLYHWAQEEDEWQGVNYDGSSGLGLMRALKGRGYIKEYRWAIDTETMAAWLLTTGPVICGSYWYEGMANTDKEGFIHPVGGNWGGHEWRQIGVNLDKKCPDGTTGAFRMMNTWSKKWGEQGRAWVSIADMKKLLFNDGDCAVPTEIKL